MLINKHLQMKNIMLILCFYKIWPFFLIYDLWLGGGIPKYQFDHIGEVSRRAKIISHDTWTALNFFFTDIWLRNYKAARNPGPKAGKYELEHVLKEVAAAHTDDGAHRNQNLDPLGRYLGEEALEAAQGNSQGCSPAGSCDHSWLVDMANWVSASLSLSDLTPWTVSPKWYPCLTNQSVFTFHTFYSLYLILIPLWSPWKPRSTLTLTTPSALGSSS